MSSLDELYHPILLARAREPRHLGKIPGPGTLRGRAHNPLCGDQVEVDAELDGEGRVVRIAWRGRACAICRGSADLLGDFAPGKSPEDLRVALADLGGIAELAAVRSFPARLKCAELPWLALDEALQGCELLRD